MANDPPTPTGVTLKRPDSLLEGSGGDDAVNSVGAAVPSADFSAPPAPLEPALSALIVDTYEGTLDEAGCFHTQDPASPGIAKFVGGNHYRGEFVKGMMHGRGLYTWADGTTYEGDFSWNCITGKGIFTWPDGATYAGELLDGLRHGEGSFTASISNGNGLAYSGQWRAGKRHGKGTLWYDQSRSSYYEGEWQDNFRHGNGSMRYKLQEGGLTVLAAGGIVRKEKARGSGSGSPTADGRVEQEGNLYEGAWSFDLKCGFGTMQWFDRNEKYTGTWEADLPHGWGEHVWLEARPDSSAPGPSKQQCNRYTGEWWEGERHGSYGVFEYAKCSRYSGAWQHNAKEGLGALVFEDGHVYEGLFDSDRMVDPDHDAPAKGPDPTMQPQLRLRVSDTISSIPPGNSNSSSGSPSKLFATASAARSPSGDVERLEVEKVALRYASELKAVYKWYSSELKDGQLPEDRGVWGLSMQQLKKCHADCGWGSDLGISMADVHRLRASMRAHHAQEIASKQLTRAQNNNNEVTEPRGAIFDAKSGLVPCFLPEDLSTYRSDQPLLFREFVELLVRIACSAYADGNDTARANQQAAFAATAASAAAAVAGAASAVGMASSTSRGGSLDLGGGPDAAAGGTARSRNSGTPATLGFNKPMTAGSTTSGAGSLNGTSHRQPHQYSPPPLVGSSDYGVGPQAPPSKCLVQFMEQNMQGKHCKPLVRGTFEASLCATSVPPEGASDAVGVLLASSPHADRLRAAFRAFAFAPTIPAGSTAAAVSTTATGAAHAEGGCLTLRGLLQLLVAAGANKPVAQGGLGLSANDVLLATVGGNDPYPAATDPTLLDTELIWAEFLDALAQVARHLKAADLPEPSSFSQGDNNGCRPDSPASKNNASSRNHSSNRKSRGGGGSGGGSGLAPIASGEMSVDDSASAASDVDTLNEAADQVGNFNGVLTDQFDATAPFGLSEKSLTDHVRALLERLDLAPFVVDDPMKKDATTAAAKEVVEKRLGVAALSRPKRRPIVL